MHILKFATIPTVCALLFANQVLANPTAPSQCPSVERIKSKAAMQSHALIPQDIIHANSTGDFTYDVNAPIYTDQDGLERSRWYFTMTLQAEDASNVRSLVQTELSTLQYRSGPVFYQDSSTDHEYHCEYVTESGWVGIATSYYEK